MIKELEALGKIHDYWNCCNPNSNGCDNEDFKLIETALKRLEELEKIKCELQSRIVELNVELKKQDEFLRIIKKFRLVEKMYDTSLVIDIPLTQEEFDLLKEVLL